MADDKNTPCCTHGIDHLSPGDYPHTLLKPLVDLINKHHKPGTHFDAGTIVMDFMGVPGLGLLDPDFQSLLIHISTNMILEDHPLHDARRFAQLLSLLELFQELHGAEMLEDSMMSSSAPYYLKHTQDSITLVQRDREVIRFFAKRVPCDCLKEKAKEAKKMPKELHCAYPECRKQNLESKLSTCASCKLASYCGRECQIKHWPTHKIVCRTVKGLVQGKVEINAPQMSMDEIKAQMKEMGSDKI